jgi:hypothetical protein
MFWKQPLPPFTWRRRELSWERGKVPLVVSSSSSANNTHIHETAPVTYTNRISQTRSSGENSLSCAHYLIWGPDRRYIGVLSQQTTIREAVVFVLQMGGIYDMSRSHGYRVSWRFFQAFNICCMGHTNTHTGADITALFSKYEQRLEKPPR